MDYDMKTGKGSDSFLSDKEHLDLLVDYACFQLDSRDASTVLAGSRVGHLDIPWNAEIKIFRSRRGSVPL